MPMKSPTVRHRRLGRELRQLRENAGLTVAETAHRLGWSISKAHRIEAGRVMVSVEDLADACDLFGADSATRASLTQLAKDAGRRGWWTAYSDVFTGSYVALEAEAMIIRKWEPLLIPGLLQSEDYARAIVRSGRPNLSESEVARRVDARMIRKVNLLSVNAPALHTLIDENALRRNVGGPAVMVRQLSDILQVMDWANITVQVLPLQTDMGVALEGAFSVLSFGEDPDVGYVESPAGEVYVEAAAQVQRLMLMFERLAGACLSPEESAVLIAAVRSNNDLP